jgi:uncharacterized protein (DUF2141 family)
MSRPYFAQMFFLVAVFIGSVSALPAVAADLTVIVEDIKTSEGAVRVGLFNNATTFPKAPVIGQAIDAKVAKANAASVTFKNIAPGTYAVSAYQDLNGNQKLDKNFVGKPVEPYGFSRNARGMFGPPAFDDARIEIDNKNISITIELK